MDVVGHHCSHECWHLPVVWEYPNGTCPHRRPGGNPCQPDRARRSNIEYMDRIIDEVYEELEEAIPEAERVGFISMASPGFGSASTNSGFIRIILKDAHERERSQQEVFEQ